MKSDTNIYWPLKKDEDFIKEANKKIDDFYSYLESSGIANVIQLSYALYYGGNKSTCKWFDPLSSLAKASSNSAKYRNLKINHYKALTQSIARLASTEKTAWSAQATKTDYEAQAQALLANQILDTYEREKRIDEHFNRALKSALIGLEGWIVPTWEKNLGEKYISDEEGKWVFEGDVQLKTYGLTDIIRDVNCQSHTDNSWYLVKDQVNKYDLAADFPEHEEKILNAKQDNERKSIDIKPYDYSKPDSSDSVTVWTFYHKQTPSCPNGKLIRFIKGQVLQNLDLPYKNVPVYRVTADTLENTPFGWSPAIDLISPQIIADTANSTMATLIGRKASQSVWVSSEDDYRVDDEGGTKVFRAQQPVQPLDLSPIPPDMVQAGQQVVQEMQLISNISAPVRGELPSAGMSGAAMALLSANSISFHSGLEWQFNRLKGDVATAMIDHLKTFSRTERVMNLISESNKPFQHTFKADDLNEVSKIIVKATNPLAKTTSGRLQIAEQLLQQGMIKSPEKYISLLRDGNLDNLIEGETTELISIKAENEAIRRGEDVMAILTDNHSLHIREHKNVLADPYSRQDPDLVRRVLAHIQEHIAQAQQITPDIAQLLQVQPIMMPPPQQPGQIPASPPEQMPNAPVEGAEQPDQPNMPTNPLSGEEYTPPN